MCAILRPAAEADAADVTRLVTQLGYPSDPATIARRLAGQLTREDRRLLVAEDEGKVIGLIHVRLEATLMDDRLAHVLALVVDEEHRGQGVGGRLLAAAEDWAAENGCELIRLHSNAKRVEAHRFYFARGYDKIKDSLTLAKRLAGGAHGPTAGL